MAATSNAAAISAERELVITRIFDAPRSLVFKAWTEPEHLAHWWGPSGFTLPECEIDARTGGHYRFRMRSSEGTEHWSQGIFSEVVAPERIVFTGGWTDAEGKPLSPVMKTTVTFEEHTGRTHLRLHQSGLESVAARESHRGGWTSSMQRLAVYLATV